MRPYALSKKLLASRYVAILLISKLPVFKDPNDGADVVGLTRVELVTSSLSGTRSNQLSYKPMWSLVEAAGFEPATCCLQSSHSTS